MNSPLFITRHNRLRNASFLFHRLRGQWIEMVGFSFSCFGHLTRHPLGKLFTFPVCFSARMVHTDLCVTLRGLALAVALNWSLSTPMITTVLLILELWPPLHSLLKHHPTVCWLAVPAQMCLLCCGCLHSLTIHSELKKSPEFAFLFVYIIHVK